MKLPSEFLNTSDFFKQKKLYLFFICITFFLPSFLGADFSAFAQPNVREEINGTQQNKVTVTLTAEDHKHVSDLIDIIQLPKTIQLNGNEADLSSVIQQLKRAEDSQHDISFKLNAIQYDLLHYPISRLCQKARDPRRCRIKASYSLKMVVDKIKQNMSGRILYPNKYRPISKKGVEDPIFQHASDILDSKCTNVCNNASLYKVLTRASKAQYQKLYDKIKNKNKQCQRDLLNRTARHLELDLFPKQCLKKKNNAHPVCKNMNQHMRMIQKRISGLMDLAYGTKPLSDTEAKGSCLVCVLETKKNHPLETLLKSLKEKSQCFELNPGNKKEVHQGNGIGKPYGLKRDLNGSYSIVFPVVFYIDNDYDGFYSKEKAPEHYRNFVQKCLTLANQKMLGPNGEKLKIMIEDPSLKKDDSNNKLQCSKKLETVTISIGSKNHRSNSRKYESDIDCPTITHEILHLTGLCDEYKEKHLGFYIDSQTGESGLTEKNPLSSNYNFKPAYDCRVTGKNSIMSDQYKRWDNVEDGKNKSLLTPKQFQSILYGSCPKKNKNFNKCSRLAYQSSHLKNKKGNCLKIKSECERENGMGYNKRNQIEGLQTEIKYNKIIQQHTLRFLREFSGDLDKSKRSFYGTTLKGIEEKLQSENNVLSLAQSQKEKTIRRENIEELLSHREKVLILQKTEEEAGLLDQTFREIYEKQFKVQEENLRVLSKKLKVVQSWPEP